MKPFWRHSFVAAGLLVPLVAIGLFAQERYAPLSPSQQSALALMEKGEPPVRGRDASDAMWLLNRDVPPEKRAQVADAIRAYEAAAKLPGHPLRDPREDWPSFPQAPRDPENLCRADVDKCLDYVAEHREQVAAEVSAHAPALASYEALADHDGYRLGFRELPGDAAARYDATNAHLLPRSLALRFLAGEPDAAMAATCRQIAGWRRIGADSDDLVISMTGVRQVRDNLILLTDMLSRLPADARLPAGCDEALAPSQEQEFALCPAMRSKYHHLLPSTSWAQETQGQKVGLVLRAKLLTVDWRRVDAIAAQQLGRHCEASIPRRLRADAFARDVLPPVVYCTEKERGVDVFGCALLDVPNNGWEEYQDRRADQAQMIALVRTIAWLRAHAGLKLSVPELLARRPASLGLLREASYDAARDRLSIAMHDTTRWKRFEARLGLGRTATATAD